ncbi:MAG: YfhO family protein [Chitinophagaceae bacterium]
MNQPDLKFTFYRSGAFVYIGLLLITLTGYWPVSSGLFALKNDDIVYFLPYRYNIVESIRNGQFPLWSPYIYMGLPVSGDMQSGAWNPLVWILGLTGRYTLTTLHIELLAYIYLGGIGMFKLMATCGFNRIVCWTIAVAYMFSGFILDSGQILCWITCAGILPFTYLYFIRLLQLPTHSLAVKFAISIAFLFVGGYPFFFIANTYFLSFAFLVFFLRSAQTKGFTYSLIHLRYLLMSVALVILLSAAPLLSFIDLLPHYSRGQTLSLSKAMDHSYALFSSISLLFPLSVTKTHPYFFQNGEISRNMYIGVLLLPFVITAVLQLKRTWWILVLVLTLLSFAISLGHLLPFRKWAYWYVPFMDSFRHPANFRLFVITGLLSLAGKGLQEYITSPGYTGRKYLSSGFAVLLIITMVLTVYFFPFKERWLTGDVSPTPQALKMVFDKISFRQAVSIGALVQVPFVLIAIYFIQRKKVYLLCLTSLLNVIVISQPQQFYSIVGKNPASEINRYLREQPAGFPKPALSHPVWFPDEEKVFLYDYKESLKSFFNKKVAVNTGIDNPTVLHGYSRFINDSSLMAMTRNYPFIFFADSIGVLSDPNNREQSQNKIGLQSIIATGKFNPSISLLAFKPAAIKISVQTALGSTLVILQNNLPGWKAYIGNKPVRIETVNYTFMAVEVPAGRHIITLHYRPDWFLPGLLVSSTGVLICIMLLSTRPLRYFGFPGVVRTKVP